MGRKSGIDTPGEGSVNAANADRVVMIDSSGNEVDFTTLVPGLAALLALETGGNLETLKNTLDSVEGESGTDTDGLDGIKILGQDGTKDRYILTTSNGTVEVRNTVNVDSKKLAVGSLTLDNGSTDLTDNGGIEVKANWFELEAKAANIANVTIGTAGVDTALITLAPGDNFYHYLPSGYYEDLQAWGCAIGAGDEIDIIYGGTV